MGKLRSALVANGLINRVNALRSLGVWHSQDNSLQTSFQKKWYGALAVATRIGGLVADETIPPSETYTLAEERLWSRVRFSLELAKCQPDWEAEARRQESIWARTIIGVPRFVASSETVTGELGWCDRLVKEIEIAALMRMARIRCLPPHRIARRAVASVTLWNGTEDTPGSWTAQVRHVQQKHGIPDITETACFQIATSKQTLDKCMRQYRRRHVLPNIVPARWKSWLLRAQAHKGQVPYLFATSLKDGHDKVAELHSVYDWAVMRLRLGAHLLGEQADGTPTRHTHAKCRLCGKWGRAHLQHVLTECHATRALQESVRAQRQTSNAMGVLQWLEHNTPVAQEAAELERLLRSRDKISNRRNR